MKKLILIGSLIIIVTNLHSQVIIQGRVKDNKGKPVAGASISLKDTYDGSVTDSSGNYKFTTTEKGDVIFIATNIGYKSYEQKLTIGIEPMAIDVTLKEELSELKAVTVISGSFA